MFCNYWDSDEDIIAEFRINYGTVPERIRQRRFVCIRQTRFAFGKTWTESARSGLNRQDRAMKNYPEHPHSPRQRPDPQNTVQTTQDIVMIVIRPDKIGRFFRMLQDVPSLYHSYRECLTDLSRPFTTRRTLLRTRERDVAPW